MSVLKDTNSDRPQKAGTTPQPAHRVLEPHKVGELDYDALADEVIRKYPKILARLGE